MKSKIYVILLIFLFLSLFSFQESQAKTCKTKTHNGLSWTTEETKSASELKKLNAQIVQIVVWLQILDDETILVTPNSYSGSAKTSLKEIKQEAGQTEEIIRAKIRDLKKNNLKVYLTLYPEWLYTHERTYLVKNAEAYQQRTREIALRWAKIAKEEKVDIFSPLNEPFLHIGYEKAFKWYKDILPDLRKVYSGLLVPRGLQAYHFQEDIGLVERADTQFNWRGWDLVAFDVYGRNTKNFTQYRRYLRAVIAKAREIKKKFEAKGIMFGEIGEPNVEKGTFKNLSTVSVTAKSWQILFKESFGLINYPMFWDWHSVPVEENGTLKMISAGTKLENTLKKLFSGNFSCPASPKTIKSPNFSTTKGKIIFKDNFKNLDNWQKEAGDWRVKNGVLSTSGKGTNVLSFNQNIASGRIILRFKTTSGSLDIKFKRTPQSPASYIVSLKSQRATLKLVSPEDKITTLREMQFYFDRNWHKAIIEFRGNRIVIKIDSVGVFEVFDETYQEGIISLGADGPIKIDYFKLEE